MLTIGDTESGVVNVCHDASLIMTNLGMRDFDSAETASNIIARRPTAKGL